MKIWRGPPVPHIPLVDPILDAVESKLGTKNFKVTLPDGTIVYHAVYDNGSNKPFVIHVQEVLNFCNHKGFFKAYDKAESHFVDCTTRSKMSKDKLTDAKNDPTTSKDRMKALKNSLELANTAVVLQRRPFRGEEIIISLSSRRS